jgi:TRAP-type C4-dicarboxylate transport system permease small subunit
VFPALARLPEIASGLLLVAVTILLFLQTAFRYVLFVPIGWAEEGARFGLIWLTFLGAAVCCRRRLHSRFGLFADRARPRTRRRLAALADLVTLGFGAVMVVKGWEIVKRTQYERWIMLDLPVSYGYLAIPVSGCLVVLFTVAHLLRQFRDPGA